MYKSISHVPVLEFEQLIQKSMLILLILDSFEVVL